MFEGILAGLFGGLFGPAIAHWLSKFRYWAIFLVATLLTQAGVVACMVKSLGFEKAMKMLALHIGPAFFYAPALIGVLAVFVAFIGALNNTNVSREDMGDKQEP